METGQALPEANRVLRIKPAKYRCHVTGDIWKRKGFTITCSDNLFRTGKSYTDSLPSVPQGYRMAVDEIFVYLAQRASELKAKGKNPRKAREDPLFGMNLEDNKETYEHTHRILRPHEGANDFTVNYVTDSNGRRYSLVDIYCGDESVAQKALMPWGRNVKVIKINPVLGMPSVVSDGKVPGHFLHSWFDPELDEVALGLDGVWCGCERGGCLGFVADGGRSDADPVDGFRLVWGSLEDVPVPSVNSSDKYWENFEDM